MRTLLLVVVAVALGGALAPTVRAQSFVNWESPHVHPLALTPDGGTLLAVNTAGAQLQALESPPPTYPAEAVRDGASGTVLLEILVGIDGRALEARVVRSSGHRALDQAARRVVLSRWRFQPAQRNGHAVQAIGRVPIDFVLQR